MSASVKSSSSLFSFSSSFFFFSYVNVNLTPGFKGNPSKLYGSSYYVLTLVDTFNLNKAY